MSGKRKRKSNKPNSRKAENNMSKKNKNVKEVAPMNKDFVFGMFGEALVYEGVIGNKERYDAYLKVLEENSDLKEESVDFDLKTRQTEKGEEFYITLKKEEELAEAEVSATKEKTSAPIEEPKAKEEPANAPKEDVKAEEPAKTEEAPKAEESALSQEEEEVIDEDIIEDEEEEDIRTKEEIEEDAVANNKYVRTTALEKSQMPKNVRWLTKNSNKLNFKLAIQRNTVWTPEQKSLFIHSLIYGYPFPAVYAQDKGDGVLWLLDGKQRLTTAIEYCTGEFKLHKSTPKCFGYTIANKKFDELPLDEFRDTILDTDFMIHLLKNMTNQERDEMFVRLNKGTPLSKIEHTRAMYSDLIEQIEGIAGLEFFSDYVTFPKNRFADQEVIMQTVMILDEDHNLKGIGSAQIQKYVAELKAKGVLLSDEIFNKFVQADDYLSMVCSEFSDVERKQILKKVHIPMVIVTALRAVEDKVEHTYFAEFLDSFLINKYSRDSDYGIACQSGSAKKENVLIRLQAMDNGYADYMNTLMKLKGDKKIKSKAKELEQVI